MNVWNENENEREEMLEEGHFDTVAEAEEALVRVTKENAEITFIRVPIQKMTRRQVKKGSCSLIRAGLFYA